MITEPSPGISGRKVRDHQRKRIFVKRLRAEFVVIS